MLESNCRRGEVRGVRVWAMVAIQSGDSFFGHDDVVCNVEQDVTNEFVDDPHELVWIGDRAVASQFERKICILAPDILDRMAGKYGHALLERTATLRRRVKRYVDLVRELTDEPVIEYLTNQLETRATPEQEALADRLLAGRDTETHAAILAVLLFGQTVDGEEPLSALEGGIHLNSYYNSPDRWLVYLVREGLMTVG